MDVVSGSKPVQTDESLPARLSVPEIARRLDIGRMSVYAMLENGEIPAIRLGKRWLVTRHAYLEWERQCGSRAA